MRASSRALEAVKHLSSIFLASVGVLLHVTGQFVADACFR
jgi:hypothetical protein